jgi:hypothetical protein
MNLRSPLLLWVLAGSLLTLGCGDSDKSVVAPPTPLKATCEGCHTDQANLQATVVAEQPVGDTGDG